jgi:hypothetical protein
MRGGKRLPFLGDIELEKTDRTIRTAAVWSMTFPGLGIGIPLVEIDDKYETNNRIAIDLRQTDPDQAMKRR